MEIQIIKGETIPVAIGRKIGQVWADAFNNGVVREKDRKSLSFVGKLVFLGKGGNEEWLAVGCLTPVQVIFRKQQYPVQGIGGIVALEKKKGYGKTLMQTIGGYLQSEGFAGMGFCESHNSPFYEKCGYSVERNLVERFQQRNLEGQLLPHPEEDLDVLYFPENTTLLAEMRKHPDELAEVPFFW